MPVRSGSARCSRAPVRSSIQRLESRYLFAASAALSLAVDHVRKPAASYSEIWSSKAKGVLTAQTAVAKPKKTARSDLHAARFRAFGLDAADLRATLAQAPLEFTAAARRPVELSIPTPGGDVGRFAIVESSVMEPALAARFPAIKTYRGQSIDDPTATITLDYTPLGFHAQVLSKLSGAYYIDPYWHGDTSVYASYWHSDSAAKPAGATKPTRNKSDIRARGVATVDDVPALEEPTVVTRTATGDATAYGSTLRTFRTAVAANGEYTSYWGGTVASGLAAVTTMLNRVSGIYQSELAVRLTLVANNDAIIYTNASTDPYSNTDTAIDANTANLDRVIGSANYDVGHVVTTGSGGLAGLGVVGQAGLKGDGTTGDPQPAGDAFYVDYVAHEMGHQFGANHTFNTSLDPNREAATAYEPGSGSTIMAYAGIEDAEDLQAHSDPYFHSASIDEIRTFLTTIPSVGTSTATGNTAPVVSAGLAYAIPARTPFALTAIGSDADGDALTYDWQQRDLGAARRLTSTDNGTSPLFRTYAPTTNPTRTFPRLAAILTGATTTAAPAGSTYAAERLPTVARTAMKFRVIARDSSGGGVASSDVSIRVVNTGSAFALTSFNSATTLLGGSTQTLAWNVAGTTASPISAANVNIRLSLDGGLTFPTLLATSVANDGSQPVQIPYDTSSTVARIKIQPTNNIFFDINNAPLTITKVPSQSVAPASIALAATSDTGGSDSDRITRLNNASAGAALTFLVGNTVGGATVEVLIDGVVRGNAIAPVGGGTTSVVTDGSAALADGTHLVTTRQTEVGKLASAATGTLSITVDATAPAIVPTMTQFLVDVPALRLGFSEDLATTLDADNVVLTNTTTGTVIDSTSISVKFDATSNVARMTFPGFENGVLPDGEYVVQLTSAGVTDLAGNALAEAAAVSFFILAGDADGDRTVGFSDLVILSQNYGQVGRSFNEGNVDRSADGEVSFADLVLFSQRYGQSLNTSMLRVSAAPTTPQAKRRSTLLADLA